jgi:hypothetical protein
MIEGILDRYIFIECVVFRYIFRYFFNQKDTSGYIFRTFASNFLL